MRRAPRSCPATAARTSASVRSRAAWVHTRLCHRAARSVQDHGAPARPVTPGRRRRPRSGRQPCRSVDAMRTRAARRKSGPVHEPNSPVAANRHSVPDDTETAMTGERTLQAAAATTTLDAAGLVGATTSSARQHTLAVRGRNGRGAHENRPLPISVLTFLMTDVAGSTRMWEERPDIAGGVLERHEAVIRTIVHERGGVLIRSKGEGDSTFSVFADACGSVIAAVEIQLALQREPWPDGADLRVRAASYTGDVELREGDYRGPAPNRCARLRAAAHPGQAVCSQSTEARLPSLPAEILRIDLGLYRLRDVACPERVFQLGHRELRAEFPPLRTPAVDGALRNGMRTRSVGAPLWHPPAFHHCDRRSTTGSTSDAPVWSERGGQ